MIFTRRFTALPAAFAALPAALLVTALLVPATTAAAKHGRGARAWTVEVGPIWNQADADRKCTKAARSAGGTWTGVWRTTREGQMSVCEIRGGSGHSQWPKPDPRNGFGRTRMVEVGPIWNQQDAEVKCTRTAREIRGTWTGQWKTTRPGQMSVCEIKP